MRRLSACCVISYFIGSLSFSPAKAQIVPDATLPNNSAVTTNGNIHEIAGGTIVGDKLLFHSFKEFSILTKDQAYFNNPLNIENIFSRVTGSSASKIDGLIRANGTANLFLLNPNGIIFGSNSSLNLGGSFVASTARSIKFANGTEFSAINPQLPALLKLSVPIGLQFGSNPGDIVVEGQGNKLSLDFDTFSIQTENRPVGLEVTSGQTLALVGGNISLQGGNLTAKGGRVELGSVNGEEIVQLTPTNPGWGLSYNNISNFNNINLSQAASIDTSGNSGTIHLQGHRISLHDGSALLSNTFLNGAGGTLTLRGSESVEVTGEAQNNLFYGGIFADVAPGATGNGGNITIETEHLLVADGNQISSGTFGSGNGGTLIVRAQDVKLIGGTLLGPSGLFAPVAPGVSGNGGNINIETGRLQVVDGAQIITSNFGFGAAGNAGKLTIKASEVEVSGSNSGNSSGLFANVSSNGTGNAGKLAIEAGKLWVRDGGLIVVGNAGSGKAGELTIRGEEVNVTGFNQFNTSLIETNSGLSLSGDAGKLSIETERLVVADGAQISSGTNGAGKGGELDIQATEVKLIGATEKGRSGLFANALIGTGEGGDINITTDKLIVEDGATINVGNFSSMNPNVQPGRGTPGNLKVKANSILLNNQSIITAESLAGERGNINLLSQDIQLLTGSTITTNARGDAKGGNIVISANSLVAKDNSSITANTSGLSSTGNIQIQATNVDWEGSRVTAIGNQGNLTLQSENIQMYRGSVFSTNAYSDRSGGNIKIATGKLSILDDSEISANARGLGSGGNVNIIASAPKPLLIDGSRISAAGNDGNITLQSPLIQLRQGSKISTNGQGLEQGGNIIINTDFLVAIPTENSDISANAEQSFAGRVIVNAKTIFGTGFSSFPTPKSDITASSEAGAEFNGIVELNTLYTEASQRLWISPQNITDSSQQIVARCQGNKANSFTIVGSGGLPENPFAHLRGQTIWKDLRNVADGNSRSVQQKTERQISTVQNQELIESQGWIISNDGKVELVAQIPLAARQNAWKPMSCLHI
jgi:filamentous hemagglutinin family protein